MKLQDLRIYFPHTEESNVGERKTIRDQPKSVGYSATVSNSKHILNWIDRPSMMQQPKTNQKPGKIIGISSPTLVTLVLFRARSTGYFANG